MSNSYLSGLAYRSNPPIEIADFYNMFCVSGGNGVSSFKDRSS